MKCFKNWRCAILISSAFVVLAVATVFLTAWAVNHRVSKSYVGGFFYRTPKQLSDDGVRLVEMEEWEEARAHRLIWEYYRDNYPEVVREFAQMRLEQLEGINRRPEYREELRIFLENFDEAVLEMPLFSVPRQHQDVEGTVAIVAEACMVYDRTRLCPNGINFFFFRGKDFDVRLDLVRPLGEGYTIYESGPWRGYIRQMKPGESDGWYPSVI